MKKVIGWILTVLGGFYCVVGVICIPVILAADDIVFGERLFVLVSFLIIAVVSGIICRVGFKLKAGNAKMTLGIRRCLIPSRRRFGVLLVRKMDDLSAAGLVLTEEENGLSQ